MTARASLLFRTLSATLVGAALTAPLHAAGPAATAASDPCAGAPRCYNAGTFIAEVTQVSASAMTAGARHQLVTINIRFRNIGDKPAILAYRAGSSAALDNFGNGFTWGRPGTHDTSVKGIGMVEGKVVDTQFQLAPGQSRAASFGIIRFNAKPPIGDAWNYDLVVEEIEIQPGQVVRSVRQNSINYTGLRAGAFPAASDASGVAGAPSATPLDVANKMIDLFNKKKNKQ